VIKLNGEKNSALEEIEQLKSALVQTQNKLTVEVVNVTELQAKLKSTIADLEQHKNNVLKIKELEETIDKLRLNPRGGSENDMQLKNELLRVKQRLFEVSEELALRREEVVRLKKVEATSKAINDELLVKQVRR
jgi:chromosome segregation ATPase